MELVVVIVGGVRGVVNVIGCLDGLIGYWFLGCVRVMVLIWLVLRIVLSSIMLKVS